MYFPLTLSDMSLWLAVTAIILLTTSELLASPTKLSRSITLDKKRLRLVAVALGLAFMATVLLRVFQA